MQRYILFLRTKQEWGRKLQVRIPRTIAYSDGASPSSSRSAMALKVCSIWCCSSWGKRAKSLWPSKAFVGYILP